MANTANETASQDPTHEKAEVKPDPVLKQPEKSHMHSKDAHPAGDDEGAAKKPG